MTIYVGLFGVFFPEMCCSLFSIEKKVRNVSGTSSIKRPILLYDPCCRKEEEFMMLMMPLPLFS